MIITRTPLRLPLGGGGTDLPSYYKLHGGFFVSAAIDKFVYITVNPRFEANSLRVNYSATETVDDANKLQHPILREALILEGIRNGVTIMSVADMPSSTGLGSSGSFTVGLLKALHEYNGEPVSASKLAEDACDIAMNRLGEPSGKQDEYVAACGGIRSYDIDTSGEVRSSPIPITNNALAELEANILMFYTGITRSSTPVLTEEKKEIEGGKAVQKLWKIEDIGRDIDHALRYGDLTAFGQALDRHWQIKRGITPAMSNTQIDGWYRVARDNGALGGKLVGAGGGGFLMLYCDSGRPKLREAMAKEGLTEYRFKFEPQGSKVIYNV